MRILLVNPPCEEKTIGLRHIAKLEPLGLELLGGALKGRFQVRIVDLEVEPDELEEAFREFQPDIVGVTSEIVHRSTALEVLRRAREVNPSCLNVVGGHHPTMCPEDFCDPAVDLIVLGEGLESFREICEQHENGQNNFSTIAGLAIPLAHGGIARTAPRPLPSDMNSYPLPDRELTARYRKKYFYLFERSVAAVRTSFGCTHHCTFCSVRVYSQGRFIPRSAESVYEEIRQIKEDFVVFCDDHSFIDPVRMAKLAHLLLEGGVKKRYFVYSRTDSIVKHREVFELWAKAGLSLVMSGLEAVDDLALKRAGKQTDIAINEEAVKIAGELGFHLSAGFLVEPNFQREDFEKIDRFVRSRPSILLTEYTPLTPFPGTPLYRQLKDQLLTEDRALFDLQHFLLPTALPPKELYRLQLRYYGRSIRRVILRLLIERPRAIFTSHTLKLLWGIYLNSKAYKRAHLAVKESQAPLLKCREFGSARNLEQQSGSVS